LKYINLVHELSHLLIVKKKQIVILENNNKYKHKIYLETMRLAGKIISLGIYLAVAAGVGVGVGVKRVNDYHDKYLFSHMTPETKQRFIKLHGEAINERLQEGAVEGGLIGLLLSGLPLGAFFLIRAVKNTSPQMYDSGSRGGKHLSGTYGAELDE